MTFTNKLHYTNTLGVVPEHEEMTQFEKVDNKKIIDAKEVHNYPMDGYNNNSSHRQLSRFNNMLATSGI